MDQGWRCFGTVFIQFKILGFKIVKNNVLGEKIVLGALLSNWNAGVYQMVQVT